MKRTLFFILILLFIAGCSGNNNTQEQDNQGEANDSQNDTVAQEKGEDEDSVDVDKKIFNVEITIPASILEADDEEQDIDQIIADAKENGIKDVKENNDGSLTYKMSKSTHKEMMQEMEQDLLDSVDEIINDDDFASIQDIEANKSFTEFTVVVEQEQFENSFDGLSVLSFVFGSFYYQLFDGVDPDNYKTVVKFKNANTGDIFDEVTYPDAFEEE